MDLSSPTAAQIHALCREALAIGRRCRNEGAEFLDLIHRAHRAVLTGEGLAEVEPQVREFSEQGPFFARAWLALVLAHLDRKDEASRIWRGLVPHLDQVPGHTPEWLIISTGSAELLALLGETDGAAALYSTLLPFAGRLAMGPAHTLLAQVPPALIRGGKPFDERRLPRVTSGYGRLRNVGE